MQKNHLFSVIREELIRASIFFFGFMILTVASIGGVAYAATSGGLFGDILSKILASNDWQNPGDGTVKNSQKLGNFDASSYQRVMAGQSCGANQCIYGFDMGGNVMCR